MALDSAPELLPDRVDTLVIGAGAAGLSLGRRLALSDSDRSVLIVDARTGYRDDRTWCFWSDSHHDLRHLVSHEWRAWRYDDDTESRTHEVPGTTYQLLRSIDVYRDAQRVIDADPFVELRLGVTAYECLPLDPSRHGGSRIAVKTSRGTVHARHVVDTRPRPTPALLFQCFAGSEVDHGGRLTPAGTEVAGLMTRMRSDDDGFAFTYVLPLTETTALIEFTRFSRAPLSLEEVAAERDAELRAMGVADAPVLRQESGVLPMGTLGAAPVLPEGVVLAGNGGGALRASTGYAFARIQAWAADCASRLARGEAPVGHPEDGVIQQQMDRIFLQALRAHPERTPDYFMALARGVAPERLLRFLTDRATAWDLAAIIASLPFTPFLAQVPDRRRAIAATTELPRTRDRVHP